MATPLRTVSGSHGDPLAEAIELTRRLKLPHIRRALTDLIPTAKAQRWDPAEVVRVLLAEEAAGRDAANLRTRRKRAGFPAGKTFGDWDETASSISRQVQDSLKTLEWISRKENLCVCGPSGTGKSHFTEALGQAAVEAGMTVAWFAVEDLGALVRRHRVDDSLARAMTRLIRSDLIIVDDIGLLPVSADAAEGFFRLVDAAYERRAMAVSSNLHPSGFDEIMPKTLATATVDRLLHHAHVVVTQGDSFRLTEATSGKGVRPMN
ncbi:IS21-like element helper ATPase IstB [Streptomyces mobaraensis NBRC 13819 = DSM 40847]|uniref:IstB domain protein ATP-binding protein n=1 Tax=Streptomyces mobaraensis (strain ATCC 29032 / DSM 40847 / JCM 4168 / NBRC 13819 / NCIMB 11159 / IPCR 16-22) TaxID=1223523 RepID=M3BQF5_STRM1|nr:IS21-like element helper ATPase IstB [Streptomyces mobaraensis]EMF01925.1 IstB domain protein ATP-binding protein [Streptomyces mobaraensis NBRC 13819 = DSM 40847]QTT74904.1 IS21-like element helper ATPase IstB [Streptomyces mobaraensis NBRC 13819 = DSM 40847]